MADRVYCRVSWLVDENGFNVHANVHVAANDRQGLENRWAGTSADHRFQTTDWPYFRREIFPCDSSAHGLTAPPT